MKQRLLLQTLFFTVAAVMLSGCLLGKLSAPDLPPALNKPSKVKMAEINDLKLGLPKGWKSIKVPKRYKKSGGIIQLKHKRYGGITIYKAPTMADARYGKLFTQTLVETVMPDYEEKGGGHAVKSGAIIQIYKGTVKVEGERIKFNAYTAYNISQGLGEYYMHSLIVDKVRNERAFYDFIAIANSI